MTLQTTSSKSMPERLPFLFRNWWNLGGHGLTLNLWWFLRDPSPCQSSGLEPGAGLYFFCSPRTKGKPEVEEKISWLPLGGTSSQKSTKIKFKKERTVIRFEGFCHFFGKYLSSIIIICKSSSPSASHLVTPSYSRKGRYHPHCIDEKT